MQMSLHQPGDVVRMMDNGIAVQPGLRTLFELHYSQVMHQKVEHLRRSRGDGRRGRPRYDAGDTLIDVPEVYMLAICIRVYDTVNKENQTSALL